MRPKYFYKDFCYSSCPEGTRTVDTYCSSCSTYDVVFDGKCMTECPFGFVRNDKNVCVRCIQVYPDRPYYESFNSCVSTCSSDYIFNENYICYRCSEGQYRLSTSE